MSSRKLFIQPVLIELKPSNMLHGEVGLFATRKLGKDCIIAEASEFGETLVGWEVWKSIDKITRTKIWDFCLLSEEGFYVPNDLNCLSMPWFMNHSCNYNVGFDKLGNFVTTRAIKKGDELTWDYGMGVSYPKYTLKCKCNSKQCRKLVTGNDWKNFEFRKRNKKYFLRKLLRENITS